MSELDWTAPNPHDARYWQAIGDALLSRRIPRIGKNIEIPAAPGIPFIHERLITRILKAITDAAYSYRWLDADGNALFYSYDITHTRTPVIEDLHDALGAGSPVSNYAEFLTRAHAAILAMRRERIQFVSEGWWRKTSTRYTDGTTLADALAYLDGEEGIYFDDWAYHTSVFSCWIDAQWFNDEYYLVHDYVADGGVYFLPSISAPCTLTIKAERFSEDPDASFFDGFDTGLSEGDNTISITAPMQPVLPPTTTYRPPATAGNKSGGGPSIKSYGFTATGIVDYGDDFILTPFEEEEL